MPSPIRNSPTSVGTSARIMPAQSPPQIAGWHLGPVRLRQLIKPGRLQPRLSPSLSLSLQADMSVGSLKPTNNLTRVAD